MIGKILSECRTAKSGKNIKQEVPATLLLVLLGVLLGAAAKMIDEISLNDAVWWHRLLGAADFRNVLSRLAFWALLALIIAVYSKRPAQAGINVFGFFVGMLAGYYTVTVTVAGFFPKTYILAWGIITLATPFLAYFTWYAKGRGWLAAVLSAVVFAFFITQAFSFGMIYLDIAYYPEVVFLIAAVIVLYRDLRQMLIGIAGAVVLAPLIQYCLPYVVGGL